MTSSMLRKCWTAAVALVAVATVVALAPDSSAKGPAKSRFAGTYTSGSWGSPITISDGGHIAGSTGSSEFYKATISGRVDDDGSYSITVTETYMERGPRDHGRTKTITESTGNMALDVDGNIVGTSSNGGSFTWVRQ